jgi:hypothetical protein
MQTGDKGLQLGTITVNGLNQSPQYTLPTPPAGFEYNNLHLVNAGGITAGAGAAAGNGAHDVIDTVNIEVDRGPKIVDNVRWYGLWTYGYSVDSFTPVAGIMPAATGAYRSEIFIPTVIKAGEVVRITVTTVGAHATYHTTSTAFAGTVAIYADMVPAGTAKNTRRVCYTEEVLDVILANAVVQYSPVVVHGYRLFRSVFYAQDTARGTLANTILNLDILMNGKYVVPPNTPWATIQAWTSFDFRRANVAGIAIADNAPVANTAADQVTVRNTAVATVATTGVVHAYLEP